LKTLKTKFAATIIVVGLICLLCSGCGNSVEPKQCAYCGGNIYWHTSNNAFLQGQNQFTCLQVGDKYYHNWCVKISRLQTELDSIKNKK